MALCETPDDSGREISDGEQSIDVITSSSSAGFIFEFEKLLKATTSEEHCVMLEKLRDLLDIDIIASLYDAGVYIPIQHILRYVDSRWLLQMESVCKKWGEIMKEVNGWREYIRMKISRDPLWEELAHARKWFKYVQDSNTANQIESDNFKKLYVNIIADIKALKKNWKEGNCQHEILKCGSDLTNGAYCIQYDRNMIVAGLRDNTAKIWDMETKEPIATFTGHSGSVLCLQYEDNCLVTGSSDSCIRIWDIEKITCVNVLKEHSSAVLCLKFKNDRLVTCSKDWLIKVWDFKNTSDPTVVKTLTYHRGAINAIDFDDKYILSASGDRTLVLWDAQKLELLHVFTGHQRGIASLHYEYPIIATGSSDYCIRMWNVEKRTCIQIVHGNEELVRCLRFDKDYLVSGSYDGKIRIWDMKTLFTFNVHNTSDHSYSVLHKHEGRVFKVIFDSIKLVSSSHDDTIIFWSFLDAKYNSENYWNPFRITAIMDAPDN